MLEEHLVAVCRLSPNDELPACSLGDGFLCVTRTREELSIVCVDDGRIPVDVKCERGWRLLRVAGTQPFTMTGVLSSVLQPLAEAEISIFAISTFDTDYVMVKSESLDATLKALRKAGHHIDEK